MKRGFGSMDDSADDSADDSSDDSASVGVSISGGGAVRPIGVSPALIMETGEDWYRGNKWPPTDVADLWIPIAATKNGFSLKYWSAFHLSIAVLGEFVQATGPGPGNYKWNTLEGLLAPTLTGANVPDELEELKNLIEYRPGVMTEALAQRENIQKYFCGVLMFNRASHPATCKLMEIARRIGQFQAMHYKLVFNRERPSQLSPALLPPIEVPGHASFPSGHATESYLIAMCLALVMPAAASTQPPPPTSVPPPPPPPPPLGSPLERMAQRIARNREVLGLHYPSDSVAGKILAYETLKILTQKTFPPPTAPASPECPILAKIFQDAKAEWL